MTPCQHGDHPTKTVPTEAGEFLIYDWEPFFEQEGWCPGKDDVSRTLDMYGVYEAADWRRALDLPVGVALDFGAHIGWYSIPLAVRGWQVTAVESRQERVGMLQRNAALHDVEVESVRSWVEYLPLFDAGAVTFIKADVEGSEDLVVDWCWSLIVDHHPTMMLECSPEFAPYYPALIDRLIGLGYTADVNGTPIEGGSLGDSQRNVWFTW